MNEIKLELQLEELNQILTALGKEPYASVFQLVHKIQTQARLQLQQAGKQINGHTEMPYAEKSAES